jgi:hypothetical protein
MKRLNIINVFAAVAAVAAVFASGGAMAVVVSAGAPVTITQSYAYTSYGGGDFVITTSAAAPGCQSGWYMKATDPGYKAAVSVVLAAQAAGLQVVVIGDNSDLWSGSPSGQYCRIQTVGLSS